MKTKLPQFYLFVAILQILMQFATNEFLWLNELSKVALMPILLLYFNRQTSQAAHSKNRLMQVALIFAWVGDIFLLFVSNNPLFFQLGLLAFLFMQCCYIKLMFRWQFHWLQIPIATFAFCLFGFLYPQLGANTIPVAVYSIAIGCTGISAASRKRAVYHDSYKYVLYGTIVFIISDSLLAINKFSTSIMWAGVWIMLTYIIGQWLIVEGIRREIVQNV